MMIGEKTKKGGVISQGIRTPVIQQGDDLKEIVISSVTDSVKSGLNNGDIIAVTEAVVAISQGNFVTHQNISDDIANKFVGAKELVIVDPIQSRNRFLDALKAIAGTPTLEKVYIAMTYPTDEVGNRLVSDMTMMESGINPYQDVLTVEEFYSKLGKPKHPFTGLNYIEEYIKACQGKAEVILCNNFSRLPAVTKCEDYLVCSIHRRKETRKALETSGAKRVLDLSQIMDKQINGSGYNEEFGLYGSNLMSGNRLKLMPRNCQDFVEGIQAEIKKTYGITVEVMVYGDGAFKDPVGGIWELADPTTTPGATSGLRGTPKEVKLKYIASAHEGKTAEEIEAIVAKESAKRKSTEDITGETSLGTTPRRITDLLASLSDLTTGSGDRQTPVVYIKNYL
ncbi:MAG: coenzyme F420-0:L-glutamate ligase [Clostridia bacterium]|nr:coenzyme F420-0:L-glutamate ligase [Clostridia bacterium]